MTWVCSLVARVNSAGSSSLPDTTWDTYERLNGLRAEDIADLGALKGQSRWHIEVMVPDHAKRFDIEAAGNLSN